MHFEKNEEATETFKKYLTLFEASPTMQNEHNYMKLKEITQQQLNEMQGGGDDYYDEEQAEDDQWSIYFLFKIIL